MAHWSVREERHFILWGDTMRKLIGALIIAAAGVMAIATGAEAAQGCGHGWHWSNARGHCVANSGYVAPRACPYHWHWSNYWGHCVHN
jgi:hypothetical protein